MFKHKNEVRRILPRLCAINARLGVRSMKGEHLIVVPSVAVLCLKRPWSKEMLVRAVRDMSL